MFFQAKIGVIKFQWRDTVFSNTFLLLRFSQTKMLKRLGKNSQMLFSQQITEVFWKIISKTQQKKTFFFFFLETYFLNRLGGCNTFFKK